jgi:NAD(P)-dependent dehydrogenase (short-subunit alcohol dehydrogenase family)
MPTLQKSAVITGASSGIGRSCVERMSRAGWQVFAGVRREGRSGESQTRVCRECVGPC